MTVANIPRIPSTLLHEVSQVSQRYAEVQRYHAERNREQNWEELSKLLALQEANRLLRNYNLKRKTIDILIYNRKHSNKVFKYKKIVEYFLKKNSKIHVIGDNLDIIKEPL